MACPNLNRTVKNEIRILRVLNAPRARVFGAWSNPEQLASWWGPKDFTSTIHEFNLKPGGRWRIDMHGPDGVDYTNESVFVEVVEPERIVFQNVSSPAFRMTANFVELAGGTELEWLLAFETFAVSGPSWIGHDEQISQNLDRLEALLAKPEPTWLRRIVFDMAEQC